MLYHAELLRVNKTMREILGTVAHRTSMGPKKWLKANESWKDFGGDYEFLRCSTDVATLHKVNAYVNDTITYERDVEDDGDHWKTPDEIMESKTGDCEDFALYKRGILKTLGYEDMLILIVDDLVVRQAHAILGVWIDGDDDGYILDNRTANLGSRLIRESELSEMKIVMSLDDDGAFLHGRKVAPGQDLL